MIEYLFGSKTRLKLLQIFFRDPNERFFVRELVRLSDTQINAVRRELATLIRAGVIMEEGENVEANTRCKFYKLNLESMLHDELRALIVKAQVMGEQAFADQIKKLGDVSFLLLSGRFVGEPDLPTDVLLVGNVPERSVKKIVRQFENKLGFDIRYTLMSKGEFIERKQVIDRFLYKLFEGKNIKVVDSIS